MTVPFDIPNALADGAGGTDPHNGGVFCDSLSERRVTMVCRIGIFAGIRFNATFVQYLDKLFFARIYTG